MGIGESLAHSSLKNRDKLPATRVSGTAIGEAETLLLDPKTDHETRLKCVRRITQALSAYAKLAERAELEAQLSEAMNERKRVEWSS